RAGRWRTGGQCRQSRRSGSWAADSFDTQNIMRGVQGRKRVAAHLNEGFNSRLLPFGLVLTRPAGKVHNSAGGRQGFGRFGCLACVDFVRGAQASKPCAGGSESGDHLSVALKAVVSHSLDAARLIKIFSVGCPRGEIRGLSKIGKKDLWTTPGPFQYAVGGIAQAFEWFGEANAWQGLNGNRRDRLFRWGHFGNIERRWWPFAQIRIVARTSKCVLPTRYRLLALGPHGCNVRLDQTAFERRPDTAGGLDLLKQLPGASTELACEIFDGTRSCGWIADLRQIRFLK